MKTNPGNDFKFRSFKQTQQLLDASKYFVYTLIRQKKLTPRYIGRKPYFSIDEINSLLESA